MSAPDVAVIGGGIVGVSAAAFLARAGARVELFERGELAAGASGRNSGAVQHPYDPELLGLHKRRSTIYRELDGFAFDPEPAGVLVLAATRRRWPRSPPTWAGLPRARAGRASTGARAEPLLAPGVAACRLRSGHPVRPEAATLAFAEAARAAGAVLHTGGGRAAADLLETAGAVLVAAGPWTPEVVDPTGSWRPIAPVWGVNVEVALDEPPRAILEEGGVESAVAGDAPPLLFSLTTADGVGALGSTFLDREPDPAAFVPGLLERGRAFVPALGEAGLGSRVRAPAVLRRAAAARAGPGPSSGSSWPPDTGPGGSPRAGLRAPGRGRHTRPRHGDPARSTRRGPNMRRLITIPISHFCEKARWALVARRGSIPGGAHVQVVHAIAARRAGGGRTVPVLVCDEGVLPESGSIVGLRRAARARRPGLRARRPGGAGRRGAHRALAGRRPRPAQRRWTYWEITTSASWPRIRSDWRPRLGAPVVSDPYRPLFEAVKRLLDVTPETTADSSFACARSSTPWASGSADGRPFLVGERFSRADLSFAALAAPVLHAGAVRVPLPKLHELPAAWAEDIADLRAHPAGAFALRMFADYR